MLRTILWAVVCFWTINQVQAADWPQWLGPTRNGTSSEKVATWKEPLPVVWRKDVGTGFSSPVVSNGRVFIHARVGTAQEEEVVAFNATTGDELWRDTYARPSYVSAVGGGPAATPTVSGNRLVTFGISGVIGCYQTDTGKRIWQRNLYQDFKASVPQFGVCCSPLVVGNHVLVSVGGKGTAVVALDIQTGEVVWQAFDEPATTASPIPFRAPGQDQADQTALFVTSLRLAAVDPLDGRLSWESPLIFKPSGPAPTPIAIGNILITSNSNDGTVATRVIPSTDGIRTEHLWTKKDLGGYFSSGIPGGQQQVCLVTNVLKPLPSASLRCLNTETGDEIWSVKNLGYFHIGVIALAENRLLVLDDSGTLKLFEVVDGKCNELAKSPACKGTLVTPALSNGQLYARDGGELVCLRLATP